MTKTATFNSIDAFRAVELEAQTGGQQREGSAVIRTSFETEVKAQSETRSLDFVISTASPGSGWKARS
jgi:hypothetical protein